MSAEIKYSNSEFRRSRNDTASTANPAFLQKCWVILRVLYYEQDDTAFLNIYV